MSDERLTEAYELIKSGDKLAARSLLGRYLKDHPDDEDGWTLLFFCVSQPAQKRLCLERVLQINPENSKARRALAKLEAAGASPGNDLPGQSTRRTKPGVDQAPDAEEIEEDDFQPTDPKKPGRTSKRPLWLLVVAVSAIAILAATFIFNFLPGLFKTQKPSPTIPAISIQISPTITQIDLLVPSQTHTPTKTNIPFTPTFTLGLPPTQVLAPTVVVVTYTPEPTNTPTITPIPSATLPPGAKANMQIIEIGYYGNPLNAESDEYILLGNLGNAPADVSAWKLEAVSKGRFFTFPKFTFQPGQTCRIYTNEIHDDSCSFSFQFPTALWNNRADCARLYNKSGSVVDEYCYNRE